MSAGEKLISNSDCSAEVSSSLKCCEKLETDQAGLGVAKTLSHCFLSASAAKSGEGFGNCSHLEMGQPWLLCFALNWPKRKKPLDSA